MYNIMIGFKFVVIFVSQ